MKTIMTGGCFNRIHEGHIRLLTECKKMGRLIVVLAHDSHNKKPYAIPAHDRMGNLESLGIADEIVIGDAKDYEKVVEKYKPDVIVIGYDQTMPKNIKTNAKIIRMPRF